MESLDISYDEGRTSPQNTSPQNTSSQKTSSQKTSPRPAEALPTNYSSQPSKDPTAASTDESDPAPDVKHAAGPRFLSTRAFRIVIGLVALAAFSTATRAGFNQLSVAETPTNQAATGTKLTKSQSDQGTHAVSQVVADAIMFHAENDTYVGFEQPGISVASGQDNIVVSMKVSDSCFYGGVLSGKPQPSIEDPTAQACSPEQIAQAQDEITTGEASANEYNQQYARQALQLAANSIPGMLMFSNGSLSQLGEAGLAGVQVVSASADSAVLQVVERPGRCAQATVSSSGQLGPITDVAC